MKMPEPTSPPISTIAALNGSRARLKSAVSGHLLWWPSRVSAANEPRERSAPAKRRARARVGESAGRSPSVDEDAGADEPSDLHHRGVERIQGAFEISGQRSSPVVAVASER